MRRSAQDLRDRVRGPVRVFDRHRTDGSRRRSRLSVRALRGPGDSAGTRRDRSSVCRARRGTRRTACAARRDADPAASRSRDRSCRQEATRRRRDHAGDDRSCTRARGRGACRRDSSRTPVSRGSAREVDDSSRTPRVPSARWSLRPRGTSRTRSRVSVRARHSCGSSRRPRVVCRRSSSHSPRGRSRTRVRAMRVRAPRRRDSACTRRGPCRSRA